ncbi:MAG: hypothetical protein V1754_09480 [Pseudomonadota bacterium]
MALQQAEEELQKARRVHLEAKQHLLDAQRQSVELAKGPVSEHMVALRYVDRLRSDLEKAGKKQEIAEAEKQKCSQIVKETQRALKEAQNDLKLVEQNREKWGIKQREQEMRRAEQELEDLVTARGSLANGSPTR